MKKIISLFIGLMVLMTFVSAMDRAPSPKPFILYFVYDDNPIVDWGVTFKLNNIEVEKDTNGKGGDGIELDIGYSPDFPNDELKTSFAFNDAILNLHCGFPICNKNFK